VVLTAGTLIGAYEVLSPLGAGGMGEVYRARDTKLHRDVALKVLSESIAQDANRVARFRREAQILASLNHPHIGGIYGLEDAAGVTVLVLELVEGPTLADRIARGALPLDEAVTIARQIALALGAAHEQGIVHRDLKPANIKVRPDGAVKVLDFGLARANDPTSPDPSSGPTQTMPDLSEAGVILGTVRYMSPEQAAGKRVDRRSDIWSFGVVLFEMLTGEHAFDGESAAHVIAAVLRAEPDWAALPVATPLPLRRVLRRCLDKDRKRRLDSATAIGLELEDALAPSGDVLVTSGSRRPAALAAGAALAAAVVAALATWAVLGPAAPVVGPPTTFAITTPVTLPWQPSTQAAARDFAVAPDGSFLVYRAGSQGQLVVRWFDRLDAVPLSGVTSGVMPFVSPDSRWVGYVEDDLTLKKVAVTGGASVSLARLPVWPRGAAWVDDATIVIGTNSSTTGLLRVPAGGGEPTVLTTPDRAAGEEGHLLPSSLPGGTAVVFTIGAAEPENAQIALLDLATGQRATLLRGGRDAQYVASGHLVYQAGLAMSAVRFDLSTRQIVGEPVRIIDGVAATPTSALNVAVTSTGTLVYIPGGTAAPTLRSLVWVDRQGRETPTGAPARPYESVRLSPDGTRAVVSIRDQQNDIWLWELARRTLTRLTFDPDVDMNPVWMPDGRRVIYTSARTGVLNLYGRDVDGAGRDVRLTSGANTQLPTAVSPDGAFVIGQEVRPVTKSDLVRVALAPQNDATSGAADSLLETEFDEWNGELSPDGRLMAYLSMESGRAEVYVRPSAPASSQRWQVSSDGGVSPVWARGGRELIYTDDTGRLMVAPVDASASVFRFGVPSPLPIRIHLPTVAWRSYDVSPDGLRFLVLKPSPEDTAVASSVGFVVVQHWLAELTRLVPVT
jgi:tRNA A-37 threonylcarbamoyl transferase component Bud32